MLATGRPLWSESYLADARFPHAAGTDSAARSEQLGGILGVPLVVGDDTLGVLLAAERRPRVFVDHDVELLAGLAAHAALALRTADLFDRERAAAAELRDGQRGTARRRREPRRASDLRDVSTRSCSSAAASRRWWRRSTGRPGSSWRSATTTAGPSRASGCRPAASSSPSTSREGHGGDLVAAPAPPPATTTAPADRGRHCGPTTSPPTAPDRRHHGGAADRVGALGRRGRAAHPRRVRARPAVLRHRRGEPGAPGPGHRHRPPRRRHRGRRRRRAGGAAARRGVRARLAAELRGVVRRPRRTGRGPRPGRRRRRPRGLRAPLRTGRHAHDRARRLHGGPSGVRAAHEEARQTTSLLLALDRAGSCAAADDLGLYRSLFSRSGRTGLAAFIRARSGPLLDYDGERQRDLAVTLETYLEQARHHARTCEVLHIHANTLYQRLDRVTEVLGPQWKEPGRALELQVALRLHRLLADRPD